MFFKITIAIFSPFRRFFGRVDVFNQFEPALSVWSPLWMYVVFFHALFHSVHAPPFRFIAIAMTMQ